MATLELFEPLSGDRADGWHRVTAPGGYEWWEFDVVDDEKGLRLVVGFYDGHPVHPEYLARYDAYLRRPTVRTPPTPREYPCVQWAVYEREKRVGGEIVQYPAGALNGAESGLGFSIGENRIAIGQEEISVQLGGSDGSISGELVFRPTFPGQHLEKRFLPASIGARHQWVIAMPLCEAQGEIRFAGRTVALSGSAYHDHYYGTAPIARGLTTWMRGRVILPAGAIAFQVAADSALVLSVGDNGIRDLGELGFSGVWDRRAAWGLAYPSAMKLGEGLIFRRPRVVDSSAALLRLAYDAYVDGEMACAWAEIFYPERLKGSLARWRMNRGIRQIRG